MGSSDSEQWLTAQQAADRMAVSLRFIRRLTSERRIPFTRIGRHVRIKATDVDAFMAAGKVEPELDAYTKMKVAQ